MPAKKTPDNNREAARLIRIKKAIDMANGIADMHYTGPARSLVEILTIAILAAERRCARRCAAIVIETFSMPRSERKFKADPLDFKKVLRSAYQESAYQIVREFEAEGKDAEY